MAYLQGEPVIESVEEAFARATEMMKSSGFIIDRDIEVAVDGKLDIMGYTRPDKDGSLIVVSENAGRSGMIEGLLIHEMSHIYRSTTNHPSHSAKAIGSVLRSVKIRMNAYQKSALRGIINHIEDLYADDIAFMVLENNNVISRAMLGRFLQGWINDKPVKTGNAERDRWINAMIMLNNSFALSNMERHSVPDPNFRGRDMNLRFLYSIKPEAAEQFGYFNRLMVSMREDISEKEYRALMKEYIKSFISVVNAL